MILVLGMTIDGGRRSAELGVCALDWRLNLRGLQPPPATQSAFRLVGLRAPRSTHSAADNAIKQTPQTQDAAAGTKLQTQPLPRVPVRTVNLFSCIKRLSPRIVSGNSPRSAIPCIAWLPSRKRGAGRGSGVRMAHGTAQAAFRATEIGASARPSTGAKRAPGQRRRIPSRSNTGGSRVPLRNQPGAIGAAPDSALRIPRWGL